MTTATENVVVEHIHSMATSALAKAQTDRQLLERFTDCQEQSAFTALVRRHGRMVLGVCRRVLHHQQDAEDAFQATFLVLARKAPALHWHDSIGNWLYGVAYRLSCKLRGKNGRKPSSFALFDVAEPAVSESQWHHLLPQLDEELHRLPEKYRAPLVLCYLEGKTRDEAAKQLGWTMHSLKGRLERGRELLRQRLNTRGVGMASGLLGVGLGTGKIGAMPGPLVKHTVEAGLQLACGQSWKPLVSGSVQYLVQGVLRTMLLNQMKTVSALAFLAVLIVTAGVGTFQTLSPSKAKADALIAGDGEGDKEGEGGKNRPSVYGTIKTIDAKAGTLTLTIARDGEKRTDKEFNLESKDIPVLVNREGKGKLSDLKAKLQAGLVLSATGDVVAIHVRAPVFRAVVASVNAEKRTITFRGGEDRPGKTLPVAKNANIRIPGKKGELENIPAKRVVIVALSLDGNAITDLRLGEGDREDGEREGDRDGEGAVVGELVSIAKGKITVMRRGDGGNREITLPLGKDVKVFAGEIPVKLDNLKKGFRLSLLKGEDRKTVILVRYLPGETRQIRTGGFLKSVDPAKNTITAPREDGTQLVRTFKVPEGTRIFGIRKENPSLVDIPKGSRLSINLAPDRETVIQLRVFLNRDGDREKDEE